MNLDQVTVPVTDLLRAAEFYRTLGLRQIVDNPAEYARFECPDGGARSPSARNGAGIFPFR